MKKFDFVKKIPAPPRDGAGIVPPVMTPLPLGSVMPAGWLKGQFRLSADGFFSHMDDISYFMQENNGWLKWQKTADEYRKEWKPVPYWNGGFMEEYHYARSAWEEQAYWLRGAYRLAVITGNPRLTRISENYFDAMLASRRPDGYFGPEVLREIDSDVGKIPDIWPHFVMADVLADRYDVTGDRRVLDLLNGFFRYCDGLPEEKLIPPRSEYRQWQGAIQMDRCCDALPVIHRVYRLTGDKALLSLSEKLYKKWRDDKSVRVNRHVVNFAERIRYAAQRYPVTGDRAAINESKRMLRRHMLKWGQMPGGLWAADENTRRGKHDPRQGTETCAMSEAVKSFTYLATLTGESGWADRSEDLMFNSYPASHTPDYKGLHYLTADNQPELDGSDHDYDNKGMMTRYSAFA
ncbi:MAG: glycoside hydrolase family 127 protein, partial [Clostridia bacterium]|nr:glycoside hydrolase family 127 protein [Clostridia bacterium]